MAKKTKTETPVESPISESDASSKEVPSQIFVTRTFENKQTQTDTVLEDSDDVLAVYKFQTEPATIRYGQGMTLNLGNYEAVRIDVAITIPTYREELIPAYEYVRELVQCKVAGLVQEVREGQKKKKTEDPF